MKLFPTKHIKFNLIDSKETTLNRLMRRTEFSENLTSSYTEKSFRGKVNGNKFKIISSEIGKGAFCVLDGQITEHKGEVNIKIHIFFRILLSIFFIFPVIGFIIQFIIKKENFFIILLLTTLQLLMIRYFFIELAFRFLSKRSLNRLRDVLDIEFVE